MSSVSQGRGIASGDNDVRILLQIAHDTQKPLILLRVRVVLELQLDFIDEGDGLRAIQFITVGHFDGDV